MCDPYKNDNWTLNGMNKKKDKLIFFFTFWKKSNMFLNMLKSNVQKTLKINVQWTKKRGGKGSVFKRSKWTVHATAFLNMLKSNVQKTLKINVQWTKKRGVKKSVFKRSKWNVRIVHYERYLNRIYTLIFRLGYVTTLSNTVRDW